MDASKNSDDTLQRFLFDDLDIRGALVRLGPVWRQMQAGRDYPTAIAALLGEMCASTLLIAGQLKQPGRLTIQLRGSGPISLLVVDCNEKLQMRGMAQCAESSVATKLPESAPLLLGHGQLLLTLETSTTRQPYQSIVPLVGEHIANIFEHYLTQSEQQPSRLLLAASAKHVAGLFLQKLPDADQRDPDGWARIEALATTLKPSELLALPAEALLKRLFHEETVRLFAAKPVTYDCPEDWEKICTMLRSLGRAEVEAILHEHGEVCIKDDICNREYRFDAASIAALFRDSETLPPTLH